MRRILGYLIFLIIPVIITACSGSSKTGAGTAPKPPGNLTADVGSQGIELFWDKTVGATRYSIFWGSDAQNYRSVVNSESNSVILRGMEKEKVYYFAVTAWNNYGESGFSSEQVIVYDDDARNSVKYLSRGAELLQKGNYIDARAYFSAAITCDPENGEAYQGRALVHEKTNRADLAKKDYTKAESINKKKLSNTAQLRGA